MADKQSSWDRVFCDRKTDNANVNWIIKKAGSYSATNKTYTLCCDNSTVPTGYVQPEIVKGKRYLVVKSGASNSIVFYMIIQQVLVIQMASGNL